MTSSQEIRKSFTDYFENPTLNKIKQANIYSVYMVKIHCLLATTHRYLIVFVNEDFQNIGFKKQLKDLEWVSLQTRNLEENHNTLPSVIYTPEKITPLQQEINIVTRDDNQSTYHSNPFNLVITILHDKKNSKYQYQPKGTIVSALQTFQTIINFK